MPNSTLKISEMGSASTPLTGQEVFPILQTEAITGDMANKKVSLTTLKQYIGSGSITVDQSYNPLSTNPQSGTATAEGIELHNSGENSHPDLRADITTLVSKDEIMSKKIDNITELLKGTEYEVQQGTSPAYSQNVPSGALKWAEISKLGGRSLVLNQVLENGNFETTSGWSASNNRLSFTASNNVLTATLTVEGGTSSHRVQQTNALAIDGHKYYITVKFKSPITTTATVRVGGNASPNTPINANEWKQIDAVVTANASNIYFNYYINSTGMVVGDSWESKEAMMIDLTKMYGAGNEPTSVEELETIAPTYIEYSTGVLTSGKCDKVVSVGKNLIDMTMFTDRFDLQPDGSYKSNQSISVTPYAVDIPSNTVVSYKIKCPVGTNYRLEFEYADGTVESGTDVTSTGNWVSVNNLPLNKRAVKMFFNYTTGSADVNIKELQVEYGTASTAYTPYKKTEYPIPQEIRSLNGYGLGLATAYNYIDFVGKKYHSLAGIREYQSGDESDITVITDMTNTVYTLEREEIVDISAYIADDNFIETETSGTVTFHQEDDTKFFLPNEVNYMVKLIDAI